MIAYMRECLYRMRGRNRYARYREALALGRLPTEELRRRQFWQISSLLHYAYKYVPYYRNIFEKLQILPEDIRSSEDFTQFPVLTRQDIQDNLSDLLSSNVLENMRYLNFSGGTTGQPIRFYQDLRLRESMDSNWLLCLSFAGWRPSDMVISIWGNPRDNTSSAIPKGLRPWLAGHLLLNAFRYGKDDLRAWLGVIGRYRRVFLYGYSSVLADLAEFAEENGTKPGNVRGVITTAERLRVPQRESIGQAFNCKVFDQYGSREVPAVSSECEHGNMHLLTHSAYAEFLPVTDEVYSEGLAFEAEGRKTEMRRIVLTNLINRAMPLIRYEVGDFGAAKDGACPCGRSFPLMEMGVGRLGGTLRLPDGRRLYSSFFVRRLSGMDGINTFQFRQTDRHNVVLYVVRGRRFSEITADKLRELQAHFPQDLCPGLALDIQYVEDVPRTAGGKHRHVICEVPDEA